MSIAYKSRYMCGTCGKYHKNGSKPQEKCELIEEISRKLITMTIKQIRDVSDYVFT